jgi:prolyl-tRNA editing enzyme YbaK/EbsC (Cys-tRNA(Pro) deacylase)
VATGLSHLLDEFEVRRFPEGTRTAQDAARAIGCSLGQIVKSLVFLAGGRPVVALVSGSNRLDTSALGRLAGEPVVKADAEVTRTATGYAIGGVPPFGHAEPLAVYIDRRPPRTRRRLGRGRSAGLGLRDHPRPSAGNQRRRARRPQGRRMISVA